MDYSKYTMSFKDLGFVLLKSAAVTLVIAYLFYDSIIPLIIFPLLFIYIFRQYKVEAVIKKMKKLQERL